MLINTFRYILVKLQNKIKKFLNFLIFIIINKQINLIILQLCYQQQSNPANTSMMDTVQISSIIVVIISFVVFGKCVYTIHKSINSRNSKFIQILFSLIVIAIIIQITENVFRIFGSKQKQDVKIEVLENFTTVFEIGVILTILYGVKVATIAITNSKKQIAKRAKFIYGVVVVILLLVNIAMTYWVVLKNKQKNNARFYVQLGNYIIMMIVSIIIAHRTWRLFKNIRQFERHIGIKSKNNYTQIKFKFAGISILTLLGSAIQIWYIITQIIRYPGQNKNQFFQHYETFLIIINEVANLMLLLFCSFAFTPTPQLDQRSLITEDDLSISGYSNFQVE